MMALVMSTITTGIFAQARQQNKQLTEEQKEQMEAVKSEYLPAISELRQEMKVISTEQRILLSSQNIDEKSIYANIDKMGKLKVDMKKQTLAMRGDMQEICPLDAKGSRQGMRPTRMHQNNDGKGQKTARNGEGMHQGGMKMQNNQQGDVKGQKRTDAPKMMAQNKGMEKGDKAQGMKEGRGKQQLMGAKGNEGRSRNFVNLSVEQKDEIAEIKRSHFWTIQETQNEIALLNAKSQSVEDQLKTVEKIGALQTKLEKQKMAEKLETMQVLTEDQRMKMIASRGHDRGQDRGHGPKGKKGKSMQGQHQRRA